MLVPKLLMWPKHLQGFATIKFPSSGFWGLLCDCAPKAARLNVQRWIIMFYQKTLKAGQQIITCPQRLYKQSAKIPSFCLPSNNFTFSSGALFSASLLHAVPPYTFYCIPSLPVLSPLTSSLPCNKLDLHLSSPCQLTNQGSCSVGMVVTLCLPQSILIHCS